MKDVRKYLVKGLIDKLATVTSLNVYTKIPKGDVSNPINYPFIHIADIRDNDNGDKSNFIYHYNVTLEIVYANLLSKLDLWATIDDVKEIITKCPPFYLDGGFKLMSMVLVDVSENETLINSEELDTAIIELEFIVE